MNCNIANALDEVSARFPEQAALVVTKGKGYKTMTFRELRDSSGGYAITLGQGGVRPGMRVMLMVRPSLEFVSLTFALFHLGATVILIDPGMGYKNLLRCIGSVKPDVLIGISKALLFSWIFSKSFLTVKKRFCVGFGFGILGKVLYAATFDVSLNKIQPRFANADDLAAVIFTTGSTGPPKGVQYTHGVFHAQLQLIRDHYNIGAGDVDQPCFPLFALFSTALGVKAVIPDMDPTRPAQVDPPKFIRTLQDQAVTYSFGSPAIWNVVSNYCLEHNIVLPLRKILMAGAPVSGELIERVKKCMSPDGEIFTPYGATESLPISSISGTEIVNNTWAITCKGGGTCVGSPLPGIDIRVIQPVEAEIEKWQDACECSPGEIGEIVVKGPVVTKAYDNNPDETSLAKITAGKEFWHRMGDMGYFDDAGKLWFCGRKAHRVFTHNGVMYTIPCEALFNNHPDVFRSAMVGVGKGPEKKPVLVVELKQEVKNQEKLFAQLLSIAQSSELTCMIETFLIHPSFPVDIRHNAKIFREKIAVWAEEKLNG